MGTSTPLIKITLFFFIAEQRNKGGEKQGKIKAGNTLKNFQRLFFFRRGEIIQ